MKTLKLDHDAAEQLRSSARGVSWRLRDDKHLHVDDSLELIDKVDPADPSSWVVLGAATIDMVVEKRLADVTTADMAAQGGYESRDALLAVMRHHYGRDVTWRDRVKMVYFSLNRQGSVESIVAPNTTSNGELKLYADGASRGNPGPSSAGFVLYTMHDQVLVQRGEYLGVTTNNQAEYQAVKLGLEEAVGRGARVLHVYLDSLLVVNQMNGKFKVKNRDLWGVHGAVKDLTAQFEKVSFTHVPRELNRAADGQANEALDDHARQQSASERV